MFGKKKLFEEKMEPRCAYCAKGTPLEEGTAAHSNTTP